VHDQRSGVDAGLDPGGLLGLGVSGVQGQLPDLAVRHRTQAEIGALGDQRTAAIASEAWSVPMPARTTSAPDQSAPCARLGDLAADAARRVREAITTPTGECPGGAEQADDRIDQLHREIMQTLGRTEQGYPVQVAVDAALLARYYERFADQAVGIIRQLDYAVTGTTPTSNPAL
jgi:phosphate transport system protein